MERNHYIQPMDIYDHAPWTEIRDLKAALAYGSTIEDAAQHLCTSGTVDEVRGKTEELGLSYKRRGSALTVDRDND